MPPGTFMRDWLSEPDDENESFTARVKRKRRKDEDELDARVRAVADRAARVGHRSEVTVRFVDPATLREDAA